MQDGLIYKINWVDIAVAIAFIRTILVGFKRGFTVEIFKLLATLCGIFVAIQFYGRIAEYISLHSPLTAEFVSPIALAGLIITVLVIFKFIRDGILLAFHIQPVLWINKWGGLLLSILRGYFLASVVILFIFLFPLEYFKNSAESSFSGVHLLKLSPKTYAFIFENIYSKFSSGEEINKEIFEAIE